MEQAEFTNPTPRKNAQDRTIYLPRAFLGSRGPLALCDFGEARMGSEHSGAAMPTPYRAPEIILGMKWGHPVDMWSVGLVVSIHLCRGPKALSVKRCPKRLGCNRLTLAERRG